MYLWTLMALAFLVIALRALGAFRRPTNKNRTRATLHYRAQKVSDLQLAVQPFLLPLNQDNYLV